MKVAVYPGTFDPITYGHIDVIKKTINIFDKVIVATTDNNDKDYHFTSEERLEIINNLFINLLYKRFIYILNLLTQGVNKNGKRY